jgi:hypothetical protein
MEDTNVRASYIYDLADRSFVPIHPDYQRSVADTGIWVTDPYSLVSPHGDLVAWQMCTYFDVELERSNTLQTMSSYRDQRCDGFLSDGSFAGALSMPGGLQAL